MISHLSGTILHKNEGNLTLDVNGVGYKISVTGTTLENLKGVSAELWTHLAVRENAQDLYGFQTYEELEFFELLISISGIGPKTALGILNVATLETLKQAVLHGNTAHLIKVGGIGKKNAEKIVMELSGKLGDSERKDGGELREEEDVLEALTSLGYSQKEARDAIQSVKKDVVGTSEKVKQALKILSTKR
ncbi:MAG: Holliday junction DNA helicase RuvA [Candidatus Zambryskibacteria bacterium RIFCSPHIGHO2_01_FULL_43_27]|uniref:Holliday junction branch migration complex subunit RuvA n=1 Tax=Candidatus Zambryskibacteria bacterium RIFCSPLOWO2_01_FULL_43_17 TaxID=1802760 RepID=A0A1G2U522_9BACT|nr:MAG: Holliday junction DNA helicase RuvA [Candidatus Zambryskibacteria bacterium RIFCSPHIGHO2_01_FULL_43_27]OHB00461.1 MAG: Holliday junction DNA helicase RuvA [Candidatus Zambryskibacteria bacterium RIFCSPHIGHO2_12_FULL_43_12b]OHB04589.1 MAG: Holliday junction DNA helicase RuvA [Candidatus Zambryskibacteria bacterium RIFCSPLOWO2_01_FULL_43_17]